MAKIRDIQATADTGRVLVDEQLQELEARLTDLYARTSREAKKDLDTFLGKFADKDKDMRSKVASGEITQEEYIEWRNRTIFRTETMTAKVNDLAQRMLHADQIAMSMVNEQLPEVYATSWNFGGYRGETFADAAGFDYTQFTIINADAVRVLATKDPDLIPWKPDVDIPEDKKWNREHLQSAIQIGIVKGDPIPAIADRLMPVVNMDRVAAVRTARTAVTGIENKGRKDATERVKAAGIPMVEAWSCTHDQRTRDTHVLMDKTLPNEQGLYGQGIIEGNLLEYPGDPNGEPSEVYNCRCAILSTIQGIDHSKDDELYAKMMEEEYYDDWLDVKAKQDVKEEQFQQKREVAMQRQESSRPKQNEFANKEQERLDSLSGGRLGAELSRTGMYDKQELLAAVKDGTIEEYKKDYISVLLDNGDVTIQGEKTSDNAPQFDISSQKVMEDDLSQKALDSGMSEEEAQKMFDEAHVFFSNQWSKADPEYVDEFVKLTPTYDGTIQRGMHFDTPEEFDAFMEGVDKGSVIGMNGRNSSWTSEEEVARRYAHMGDEEVNSVMIICDKNVTSSAACRYSQYPDEREVLASSTARWTVTRTEVQELPNGTRKAIIHVIERTNE